MAIYFEPIPLTPVNLAQAQASAWAALCVLSNTAWGTRVCEAVAREIRAQGRAGATAFDNAFGLLELTDIALAEAEGDPNTRPENPPFDQDQPPPDPEWDWALTTLQQDETVCADLRAALDAG